MIKQRSEQLIIAHDGGLRAVRNLLLYPAELRDRMVSLRLHGDRMKRVDDPRFENVCLDGLGGVYRAEPVSGYGARRDRTCDADH